MAGNGFISKKMNSTNLLERNRNVTLQTERIQKQITPHDLP